MMAGAAHDPVFAKKVGVPTKVAKEFNKADDKSGFLSSAMRAKGPAYKEGGKVKKYAEGSQVSAEDEAEYRRSGQYLADRMRLEAQANKAKMDAMMKKIEENRRKAPPARSDRNNPDAATITKPYAKGGNIKKTRYASGGDVDYYEKPSHLYTRQESPKYREFGGLDKPKGERAIDNTNAAKMIRAAGSSSERTSKKVMEPREDTQSSAFYRKGGGVKGKGCEQRGTRPAKYY
ncbi:MAG: hypothetical protein EBT13_12740 [Rhodobacteraceae bacterium]|nr:hypothetical protein [Paracoccaceae bacterium]